MVACRRFGKASYLDAVLVEWGAARADGAARTMWEIQSKRDTRTKKARQSSKRVCFEDIRHNIHVFIESINLLQKYVVERGPQVLLLLLAFYRAELAGIDFLTNISSD